ncbi:hypothetical protein A3J56_00280 [Candidatus Giovannonibacteria bacterium RIFCSPHIGHO2_02_FULL_46_20]|uniref:Uncharacterized protein n=1 Tax=Candidatus Giovannonibacteria bacterium RIFCSPHIGHO2_02_FULL_46_20 TaxID=1798338 RepID=A0A1F5WD16_9BACT|nr:MAG: hypothetical protein A3J56_00280 [Candidatus Giovannonibacteria bacterium RIFCSPHIGHO2_02_FULL_46_20]
MSRREMEQFRTIRLRLSKGVRIPNWIKYLQGVDIGFEQVYGKRIRFIEFRRANFLCFGRDGCVWLFLPQFTEAFSHFRRTLQVLDSRNQILDQNIFLCPRCLELSGKLLGDPIRVRINSICGKFSCKNLGCSEFWERTW